MWETLVVGVAAAVLGGVLVGLILHFALERRIGRLRRTLEVEIVRALARDESARKLKAHVADIEHALDHFAKGDLEYGTDVIEYRQETEERMREMRKEGRRNETLLGKDTRDIVTRYTDELLKDLPALSQGARRTEAFANQSVLLAGALENILDPLRAEAASDPE